MSPWTKRSRLKECSLVVEGTRTLYVFTQTGVYRRAGYDDGDGRLSLTELRSLAPNVTDTSLYPLDQGCRRRLYSGFPDSQPVNSGVISKTALPSNRTTYSRTYFKY